MDSPTPNKYPDTDSAEREAIANFKSLLDFKRVKPDIAECDKKPNTDGSIELLDIWR